MNELEDDEADTQEQPQQPHGGLRLPSVVPGVGASKEREINARWQVYEKVLDYLSMEVGIVSPVEPKSAYPELGTDELTTADSHAYTDTFAKLSSWFGYLTEVKARHDAKLLGIKAEMEDIETTIRERLRKTNSRETAKGKPKPPSALEMSDAIAKDTRYTELAVDRLFQEEVLLILNARIEKCERELRLISRQVEIRRLDFEQANRGSNIQGRGGLPNTGGGGLRAPSFRGPPGGGGGT